MNSRRNIGLVAAAATLLAATPLATIFDQWTWLFQVGITLAVIAGAATLARTLRAPLWAQAVAMAAALLIVLTWLFPSGHEILAVIPSPSTFERFGALLTQAMEDVRGYGIPVPDLPGLLFLTVAGIGAVGILVDLLAVGLRRPALAGLPMLAIYSVPVAVHTGSVPALPFIIGALGFLWLLVTDNVDRVRRFGRRFTGEGRDVDLWEPSPLAAAGRRLAVVGVLAAVLVPVAIPGMTSGLLDSIGTGVGDDGTGEGSARASRLGQINLFAELSGKLTQTETYDMIRVITDDPDPYYLRFAVADRIEDRGFASAIPRGGSIGRGLDESPEEPAGVDARNYSASVEVLNFDEPYIPVYGQPTTLRGLDSTWLYDKDRQVVYSNRSRSPEKKYQFTYVHRRYDPAALRTAKALAADDPTQRNYGSVTTRNREISAWVQKAVVGKDTMYDKVRALYDSLSPEQGFTYSTTTKPGSSPVDIVNFLNSKQGFCEQYAAALAWLVRAAGYPARVAFGFTRGGAADNDVYTLTNRNLHAWTEVYFSGFGWVPFDATPAGDVAGSAPSAWAPDTSRPAEPTPSAAAPGGPAAPADPVAVRGNGDGAQEGGNTGSTPVAQVSRWVWWTAGGIVALLILLAAPAVRRALLRRRRSRAVRSSSATVLSDAGHLSSDGRVVVTLDDGRGARRDAHHAWEELLDTLIDYRIPVDPAETTRVTADRIATEAELDPPAAEAARVLGRAEEHARYARQPLPAEGLPAAVRTVRRSIARHVSRGTRLRAVLLPPSVLLRWRTGLGDGYARVVGAMIRGRDATSRLNPRRRLLASRGTR